MGNLIGVIVSIGICILLFLLLRHIVLWYWKVDVIIKNQEIANDLLSQNNDLLRDQISQMKAQAGRKDEHN